MKQHVQDAAAIIRKAKAIEGMASEGAHNQEIMACGENMVRIAEIIATAEGANRIVRRFIAVEADEIVKLVELLSQQPKFKLDEKITAVLNLPLMYINLFQAKDKNEINIITNALIAGLPEFENGPEHAEQGSWMSMNKRIGAVTSKATSLMSRSLSGAAQLGARSLGEAWSWGEEGVKKIKDTIMDARDDMEQRTGNALLNGAVVGGVTLFLFPPLAPAAAGLAALNAFVSLEKGKGTSSGVDTPAFDLERVHVFKPPAGDIEGIVFAGKHQGRLLTGMSPSEMKEVLATGAAGEKKPSITSDVADIFFLSMLS